MALARTRTEPVSNLLKRQRQTASVARPAVTNGPESLQVLSLSTAIGTLAEGDVDELARVLLLDPPLRKALQDRMLRCKRHIGELADEDLMEIVISSCDDGSTHQKGALMRVKALPFRVRAAVKLFFRNAFSKTTNVDSDVCNFQRDGRLQFHVVEADFYEQPHMCRAKWTKAYLQVVRQYANEIQVPTREEAGISTEQVHSEAYRHVDLRQHWPHLQIETLEYDAYDLIVNDCAELLGYQLDYDIAGCFFEDTNPELSVHVGNHIEAASAVWVRKPRVRFVVAQRCECHGSEEDDDDDDGEEGGE